MTDPANYCPIAILPFISKILEKIIHKRIYDHISDNNLSPYQAGYRARFSTLQMVHKLTDDILIASDNRKITGAVFIDLKKAFNTVSHKFSLIS